MKKEKLKKELKIYIIYFIMALVINKIVNFENIYNLVAFVSMYCANLLYVMALVLDKKENK